VPIKQLEDLRHDDRGRTRFCGDQAAPDARILGKYQRRERRSTLVSASHRALRTAFRPTIDVGIERLRAFAVRRVWKSPCDSNGSADPA
jgi:hypothetical protein